MIRRGMRSVAATAALFLAAVFAAADAHACTVCFGDSEAAVLQGAQQATLLMVGITYLLLSGGVAAFVILRRRARRAGRTAAQEGASR